MLQRQPCIATPCAGLVVEAARAPVQLPKLRPGPPSWQKPRQGAWLGWRASLRPSRWPQDGSLGPLPLHLPRPAILSCLSFPGHTQLRTQLRTQLLLATRQLHFADCVRLRTPSPLHFEVPLEKKTPQKQGPSPVYASYTNAMDHRNNVNSTENSTVPKQ